MIRLLFRYIRLRLIDWLLGDEIELDQEKWLADEYRKVLDEVDKLKHRR